MSNKLKDKTRRYKLDSLLIKSAKLSINLYFKGMSFTEIPWRTNIGGLVRTGKQILSVWQLADLSYFAILNSNDYRANEPSEEDVFKLCNILAEVENEAAPQKFKSVSNEDKKSQIFFGLSQKTFWYQEMTWEKVFFYNFLRYYILLSEIPHFFNHKHPNEDMIELTGFDIKSFAQLLISGWACLSLDVAPLITFKVSDDFKKSMPVLTEKNLKKCFSFFTADYRYYRGNSFPNNPLFFKPVIKTDTNKFIISNAFIWSRQIYEGIFWLLRNKYMKEGSQAFMSNFGEYYERYIQELLRFYLDSTQYKKIQQENGKKADWLIETSCYIIVIEQKSSLMTISLKKEYPSLHELDTYLAKFKEAYLQLAGTVNKLKTSKKKIIKFVLHFEKLYIAEVLKERVNKSCKDEIGDLSNYFFIDTEEFEKLIQLLSDDEYTFNKVIETKLDYEENPPPISEGREFKFVIEKFTNIAEVKYLEKHRYLFDQLCRNIEG